MPATGRTLTVEQMWQHIIDLATAFRVQVYLMEGGDYRKAMEHSRGGVVTAKVPQLPAPGVPKYAQVTLYSTITVAPVVDDMTYAIALHELGHACDPRGIVLGHLERENAAWEWAYAQSLDWTPGMQRAKEYGMESHVAATQERAVITKQQDERNALDEAKRTKDLRAFIKKVGA